MPKKSKKLYQNVSAIYVPGFDEIWDDTELISQYDEALRDWKEQKFDQAEANDEVRNKECEAAPDIGPWVAVEAATYNPETAIQANYVPALNDFDMMNFYDDALKEWKDEREPERWSEIIQMLQTVQITEAEAAGSASPKDIPWVLVDEDEGLRYEDAEEFIDDMDAANVYLDALQEWKEERLQASEKTGSEPQNPSDQTVGSNKPSTSGSTNTSSEPRDPAPTDQTSWTYHSNQSPQNKEVVGGVSQLSADSEQSCSNKTEK